MLVNKHDNDMHATDDHFWKPVERSRCLLEMVVLTTLPQLYRQKIDSTYIEFDSDRRES